MGNIDQLDETVATTTASTATTTTTAAAATTTKTTVAAATAGVQEGEGRTAEAATAAASAAEFWILEFPFAVHAGWITVATVMNANVLATYESAPATTLVTVAIVSIAILYAASVCLLLLSSSSSRRGRPVLGDGVSRAVGFVFSWGTYWIYDELKRHPKDSIVSTFDEQVVAGISNASLVVSVVVSIQVLVGVVYRAVEAAKTNKTTTTKRRGNSGSGSSSSSTAEHDGSLLSAPLLE